MFVIFENEGICIGMHEYASSDHALPVQTSFGTDAECSNSEWAMLEDSRVTFLKETVYLGQTQYCFFIRLFFDGKCAFGFSHCTDLETIGDAMSPGIAVEFNLLYAYRKLFWVLAKNAFLNRIDIIGSNDMMKKHLTDFCDNSVVKKFFADNGWALSNLSLNRS